MNNSHDIVNTVNKIRKYFSGLDLNIDQVIMMYVRNDFKDNISFVDPEDIFEARNEIMIRKKTLVKRKYI